MPTVKQLRYLAAIADTAHFARAAQLCHVTQPTLSAQIAALETHLGARLVERGRQGVSLTPVGRQVLERASVVLRCIEEIRELCRTNKKGMTGILRLGVLPTLGPYLLPELLPDIRAHYPLLQLYVREETSDSLVSNLHRAKYDAVFTSLPISGQSLRVRRLFWEPILMAIPHDHPLGSKRALSIEDLRGQAVLTLEPGHVMHRQIREICEQYGADLQLHYEGTSLDTLRIMVSVGMGIALLPALYVHSEMPKAANVRVTVPPNAKPGRTIGLVWRNSSPQSHIYEQFADSLKQIIRRKFNGVVHIRA